MNKRNAFWTVGEWWLTDEYAAIEGVGMKVGGGFLIREPVVLSDRIIGVDNATFTALHCCICLWIQRFWLATRQSDIFAFLHHYWHLLISIECSNWQSCSPFEHQQRVRTFSRHYDVAFTQHFEIAFIPSDSNLFHFDSHLNVLWNILNGRDLIEPKLGGENVVFIFHSQVWITYRVSYSS